MERGSKKKYENEKRMMAMKNPGSRSIVVNRRKTTTKTNCSPFLFYFFSIAIAIISFQ